MSYKFDDAKKVIELSSQNLKYLAQCDSKIRGVEATIATPERIAEARFGHWPGVVLTPTSKVSSNSIFIVFRIGYNECFCISVIST